VLNDGYEDSAVELLNGHKPGGPYRGGKYSKFDAGTRVPTLIRWPGVVKPKSTSDALIGQNDFLACMASLLHQPIPVKAAPDSKDVLAALLGKSTTGRTHLIEHGMTGLALLQGDWKYIPPHPGGAIMKDKNMELGNAPYPQLYQIKVDPYESNNLATKYPEKVKELDRLLKEIQSEKK
jgi:arylsulfatase A-like enzyme